MGVACSSDEKTALERGINRNINSALTKDKTYKANEIKLLLLGPSSSGKSTILKQMTTIYGAGFSENDRQLYKQIIFSNLVDSMTLLINNTTEPLTNDAIAARDSFREYLESHSKSPSSPHNLSETVLGPQLSCLWSCPAIRSCSEHGANFHLFDSCFRFFDGLSRLLHPSYLPTDEDIFHARAATSGIHETNFDIEGMKIRMIDVGGQRSERRKWIHCFEGVDTLLYVAAVSEFNQMLVEDQTQNRLTEALVLFKGVINLKWFKNTSVILFLNKRDLLINRLKKVSFSSYFPEYRGANSFEGVINWVENQFQSQNEDRANKKIYSHVTWATDTKSTRKVLNDVRQTIIEQNLAHLDLK